MLTLFISRKILWFLVENIVHIISEISVISFTLFVYMARRYNYWRSRGVTAPLPFPVVGNLWPYWIINESPGHIIKKLYDNYSEPYIGFYACDKPCLLIRDPKIIHEVLVRDFSYFTDKFMRSSEKDPLSNKSLPFLPCEKWRKLRGRLNSAFTPINMKNNLQYLKKHTDDLDDHFKALELKNPGEPVDVKEIMAKYATDIAGSTGFGLNLNCLNNEDSEFRKYGKKLFGDFTSKRSRELMAIYMLPPWIKNVFDFRFIEKEAGIAFKNIFEDIITGRTESGAEASNNLLDILIQIAKDDPNFSSDDIVSQAIVFFTASFDTTSTVLSRALFELAKNEEIQGRLRQTIVDAMKETGGEITYKMIRSLSFLDSVVSETVRMHPTVPTIDRIATAAYTIQETGLVIDKGTPIMISITGLHYDSAYFDEPNVFRPERFSHNSAHSNAYMPFGIGQRSCIAKMHGLRLVKYGLIHIISKYFVTLSENTTIEADSRVYFTSGKESLLLYVKKIEKVEEN